MIKPSLRARIRQIAAWRHRYLVLFAGVLVLAAAVGLLFVRGNVAASALASPDESAVEQAVPGAYRWSYSIKFVCGYQPELKIDPGVTFREPVVKPGNYATDININNPHARELALNKWITVMVQGQEVLAREPESVGPRTKLSMVLKPYNATMDDCNNLWRLLQMPMPPPPASSLTIGYLVIQSPLELDIDAVYTAEVPYGISASGVQAEPTGISIDVERVGGKRVYVPAGQP
jgi:hypothetical protein